MKKGFTLMELIIVIIVIAILVAIGLPNLLRVAERARAAEAVNILGSVRTSQMRYHLENAQYAIGAGCANLDIEFTDLKHFGEPVCANNKDALATMARSGGDLNYTLSINLDGDITCTNDGDCAKAGF